MGINPDVSALIACGTGIDAYRTHGFFTKLKQWLSFDTGVNSLY